MRFGIVTRCMSALAMMAVLGGCLPPELTAMTATKPVEPVMFPDAYVARADGSYSLPAIPVEQVPATFQRQVVPYPSEEVPGTIIIDPASRLLYLVQDERSAIRYGISVGRAGFEWSGEALVTNKRPWPTWTPPPEMIERDPKLVKWEKGQPGGPTNPLGARAIYLTTNGVDYGYRIHGTPEWQSIGRNASSGCIRMINQDVVDLYNRVQPNAKVIVLTAAGTKPTGLSLPPPAPKKPKPAAVVPAVAPATPAPVTPAVVTPLPSFNPVLLGQVPPSLQAPATQPE
ncbi:L,D-transpeptidase [Fertoebacter nigrum]|uniref:L,D-transpeptidase n=1 Tax=Fertoeibacter niger TaxID=2656921 RepID=A0A8X8KPM7_9RHOB|nr:L,D-transpeptidase [Fertoeibacter niger]NUB43147.1 L,D-transpeptidase [Fertoeibacter niger]